MLHIHLLGGFRIESNGGPLNAFRSPRLQSLLSYLLLHRNAPQMRQHVAFLFWPDTNEKQAHTNLRNLIHLLRDALPNPDCYLDSSFTTIQWRHESPCFLDVAEFEAALARARSTHLPGDRTESLQAAVFLYAGDLLPHLYDDWLAPERARLQENAIAGCNQWIECLVAAGNPTGAIAAARRLVRFDPLDEASHRTLMRLLVENGDRAGALRVYHACASILERELNATPSQETHALYAALADAPRSLPSYFEPQQTARFQSPFLGRIQEREQILGFWRAAEQGRVRLVLVKGEAGIGKSRLAEESAAQLSRQGVTTAWARAYATTGEMSYAPLVEWLRAPALEQAAERLDSALRTELAALLPDRTTKGQAASHPPTSADAWRRTRLFEAISRALLATNRPLLLVLDDLQAADQETLDFLQYLPARHPDAPILVLMTVRGEALSEGGPLFDWQMVLARHDQIDEVVLEPLTQEETAALGAAVARHELEPEVAARLYHETEGHPLFVVEMVRAGQLNSARATVGVRSVEDATLPAAVRAVLQARLAQLDSGSRQLLELAAVVGREFAFPVLAHASALDEETLVQRLDTLWRQHLIREQGTFAYDFSHEKLREVAYAGLGPAQRRQMHQRVAQALLALHGGDLREDAYDAVSSQVAFHFEQGGRASEAVRYYWLAAHAAQRIYAHEEAIRHLTCAILLWTSARLRLDGESPLPFDLSRLHERRGEILFATGQADAAREAYLAARDALSPGESLRCSNLLCSIGKTWEQRPDYGRARACYDQAERLLGNAPAEAAAGIQEVWLQIQLQRIWTCYWLNELEAAEALAARVSPVLERSGTPYQQINYYLALGGTVIRRERHGPSAEAVSWARRALQVAQALGDESHVAWAQFITGFFLVLNDDVDQAAAELAEAHALAQKHGDIVHQARCLTYLAMAHRKQNNVAVTQEYARRGMEVAEAAQMLEYIGTAHGNLAWVALRQGDYDQVEVRTELALHQWRQLPSSHASCVFQWTALFPRMAAALARPVPTSDVATGIACANALLAPTQQRLPDSLAGRLAQADAAWQAGLPDMAATHLSTALELAHRHGYL